MWRSVVLIVCVTLLSASAPSPALGAVTVAILPVDSQLEHSEVFDLQLMVTEAGSAFNGYDITIEFDPSLLTFVPRPQSQQEGALMTGACGNRFHVFEETNGVITLNHILLCAGVSITGPGVLYQLRFQAGTLPAATQVAITAVRFANAGIETGPVQTSDAAVQIGTATAVPSADLGTNRSVLRPPYPNPFRTAVHLAFMPARSGRTRLDVFSVSGKLVRHLADRDMQAGETSTLIWDGRNEGGRPVSPGAYWVRMLAPDGPRSFRLIKIR